MKRLSLVLLIGLIYLSAVAQEKINTGSYALHGRVKVLREKSDDIKTTGDTSVVRDDEIFFDKTGKIQRIVHHVPFNYTSENYHYDGKGRLESIEQVNLNIKFNVTRAYQYKGNDSTYTVISRLPDGHVFERVTFENGKRLGIERYNPDSSKSDWTTYTYDQRGRLTGDIVYYHQKLSYRDVYQYNGTGRDNTSTFYDKNDKPGYTSDKYYDAQGRLIRTVSHMSNGKPLREVFKTYDAHGNEIEEREVDGVANTDWKDEYQYDAKGNWTKRHIFPAAGKRQEPLFFREIEYY